MEEIDLFKINETLSYRFYQMPKELFENPRYKNKLSLESKVAYSLLFDRLQLSKINKWFNENDEIYLIYTRLELIDELKISKTTASKIFKELSECNLIKEERLGQGLPNRIYIGKIKTESVEDFKKRNFRSLKNGLLEVQNSISRSLKEYPNNTDINNTDNICVENKKIFLCDKVSLYKEELINLVETYTIEKTAKFIVELNMYKLSSGKEYVSDYNAILRWVVNKVKRDEKRESYSNKNKSKLDYKYCEQRDYDNLESYYDNI